MRSKLPWILFAAMALLSLGVDSAAMAQAEKVSQPDQVGPPTTIYTFEGAEVDGLRAMPSMSYGVVAKAGPFQCMVKVRKNFLPELQNSVSSL